MPGCRTVRQHLPPPERGVPPRDRDVHGECLPGAWKGRQGEYCGWPSMHACAWFFRKELDLLVADMELRLPQRPTAVLPPSRPLPLVFCHAWISHPWPPPPLPEEGVSSCPPCSLHSRDSRGVSTIPPEGEGEMRRRGTGRTEGRVSEKREKGAGEGRAEEPRDYRKTMGFKRFLLERRAWTGGMLKRFTFGRECGRVAGEF